MRAIRGHLMAFPALLGALALVACGARLPARGGDMVAGALSVDGRRPTRSDPPPPEGRPSPPPKPSAGPRAAAKRDRMLSRKGAAAGEGLAGEPDSDADETWAARASTKAASLDSGARPDDGDQQGRPLARRPEEGVVAPPGPPLRYLSPAPLRPLAQRTASPEASDDDAETLDVDPAAGGGARRPTRAPATGLALDDSIPETGIGDPDAIGSYHVQIATSPDFGRLLFDKIYPFMGEVELEKDVARLPGALDLVWIRWSLVDLLDYEHPFTRPQRMKLARGGAD